MEYTIEELIGMINLGVIIARAKGTDKVEIPVEAALEMSVQLTTLKDMEKIVRS